MTGEVKATHAIEKLESRVLAGIRVFAKQCDINETGKQVPRTRFIYQL